MSGFVNFFPLHIFPPGGLASSVVTTVWVGVFVVALFNLRFGWVMSGLIVPGYLVPLLLIKPVAVLIVVVEGTLTYALVWAYSEWFAQRTGMSRFFGRDRFFALVLVSIAVRILSDGWALPWLGEYLNQQAGWEFDYQNNLHSFGLIIAALVANNFWKTGFVRGAWSMLVTCFLTWLIVRYGLMELTNFSLSSIGFLYEDIASSFLASPKSYIILMLTAYLASRMNLHYGWDFSGILIPSLLALQWFEPLKILTSFVEAGIILLLADLVLRAPLFQRITVEGARKVLLFFNLSFLYKILLGHWFAWQWPHLQVSDYYGFGYLLPTLIAIKMHDKKIAARMSVSILQTSLAAALLAAGFGFVLTLLQVQDHLPQQARSIQAGHIQVPELDMSLRQALLLEKQAAYQSLTLAASARKNEQGQNQAYWRAPDARQMQEFARVLRLLQLAGPQISAADLQECAARLRDLHYKLRRSGDILLLTENGTGPRRHYWGSYLINLGARNQFLIEVPLPLDEAGSLEAGLALFADQGARYLAVAGTARQAGEDGRANVLVAANTLYQVFHRQLAGNSTLQVRTADTAEQAGLWLKREVPHDLSLAKLQSALGKLPLYWTAPQGQRLNLQRESIAHGFAQLHMHPAQIQNLLQHVHARAPAWLGTLPPAVAREELEIHDFLFPPRTSIAANGSNAYQTAGSAELIYLDKEVLQPLLKASQSADLSRPQIAAGLQAAQQAAASLGYRVRWLRSPSVQQDFLVLEEVAQGAQRRYWGSYLLRVGASRPYLVQVPRPYFDPNSLEIGAELFQRLQAGAILISGTSPLANQDRSADLLNQNHHANLFNLAAQSFLHSRASQPWLTLQTRAINPHPGQSLSEDQIVLAFANGAEQAQQAGPLGEELVRSLQTQGRRMHLATASAGDAPFNVPLSLQNLYLSSTQNKQLALLWVSPLAAAGLRQESELEAQQIQALHIARRAGDLGQIIKTAQPAAASLPPQLRQHLNAWLQTRDVVRLHAALQAQPQLEFEYLQEASTRRGYLLLWRREGEARRWLAVLNLGASEGSRVLLWEQSQQAQQFIRNNHAWWLARS